MISLVEPFSERKQTIRLREVSDTAVPVGPLGQAGKWVRELAADSWRQIEKANAKIAVVARLRSTH